ncbi:unnamed protein product [Closterium sp. NIES-53]
MAAIIDGCTNTTAATACSTAGAGGGAAGSAGSAAGAGGAVGAIGSAGCAAGAGGAGPTTDYHCVSWPLSRQLQWLGVDSSCHCLSRMTPPLSSFESGFSSEPVQVVAALVFYVLHRGGNRAATLGASESAAALGASESAAALGVRASPATGPSSAEALHTFTLDSGASRCFFCDCTTLTPLAAPVLGSLADPTRGLVVARASTILPCPAVPSGTLSGLHLSTFSTNLVSASGQLAVSCSCRVLSHKTLLCHHRLNHPSLPRLRRMHSRLLVSGIPRSLPSLPCSPTLPCLPCVEERQRAAPHSSEFPPTTASLQTLHMDVWGPAPVGGMDQERYFLLVVDDYTCYTTVFPLCCKADVSNVLFPWIRATRHQLRERFSQDFPVLRCTLTGARHIGLIMEVACTSMIHAAAPHSLWPFVVQYAVHQLNLWPCVSEPETLPTLWWTGKVSDASVFRVWGALSLVRDAKASKLSSLTLRCIFLAFPTDAPLWQFYHPRERRVFSSQDVTFDKPVCYYRLHPHASHPGPAPSGVSQVDPPPLVEPLEISSVSSGPAEGGDPAANHTAATRRSPRLETPPSFPPRPSSPPPQQAAVDSGAETAGAEPGGAETEGEGSGGAAIGGAGSGGAVTGGAGSLGAATGGAHIGGPASPSGGGAVGDPAGGPGAGQPPQPDLLETLSPQVILAWIVRRGSPSGGGYGHAGAGAASPGGTTGTRGTGGTAGGAGGAASAGGTIGAAGAGGARATSPRGATVAGGAGPTSPGGTAGVGGAGGAGGAAGAGGVGAGGTGGAGAAGPGGARNGGAGAAGAGGAICAGGATGAPGSGGTGGTAGAGGDGAAGEGGTAGAGGAGGATGAASSGGAGENAGAGGAGAGGTGRTGGAGAADPGGAGGAAGAAGAGGASAAGDGGARAVGTAPCRSFFYPQPQSSLPLPDLVLRHVLSLLSSTGLPRTLLCPPTD